MHCFWFGDLNFRVLKKEELADVAENMQKRLFRRQADFQRILAHDELSLERDKGFCCIRLPHELQIQGLFKGFREAVVKFPPTHKFRIGTSLYMHNRMPSYTVRRITQYLLIFKLSGSSPFLVRFGAILDSSSLWLHLGGKLQWSQARLLYIPDESFAGQPETNSPCSAEWV